MKPKTLGLIGQIATITLRFTAVVAWGAGFSELSWPTKWFWLAAGIAWTVQDVASTFVWRAKKAEREAETMIHGVRSIPLNSPEGRAVAKMMGMEPPPEPPKGPTN